MLPGHFSRRGTFYSVSSNSQPGQLDHELQLIAMDSESQANTNSSGMMAPPGTSVESVHIDDGLVDVDKYVEPETDSDMEWSDAGFSDGEYLGYDDP